MSTPELEIVRVEASSLYALRRRVLRGDDPTKSVADARDDETSSMHFAGLIGTRLVVSASFFVAAAPTGEDVVAYQLRFMATDFDVQGRGYGALVLAEAERVLAAIGVGLVWAHARDSALGFYRATGWSELEGTQHLSAETRLPHTTIVKRLS